MFTSSQAIEALRVYADEQKLGKKHAAEALYQALISLEHGDPSSLESAAKSLISYAAVLRLLQEK
jgi:hypothetical protein